MQGVEDECRSENGDIWADFFDFLFAYPLGSESPAVGIRVSPSSRNINESLNFLAISNCLSYGHWYLNVRLFEVLV
jgi:hypothetical protein